MGMRYRKSINLGGGVKLNLNKKSVGVSAGSKHMRHTVNSAGAANQLGGGAGDGSELAADEFDAIGRNPPSWWHREGGGCRAGPRFRSGEAGGVCAEGGEGAVPEPANRLGAESAGAVGAWFRAMRYGRALWRRGTGAGGSVLGGSGSAAGVRGPVWGAALGG